VVGSQWISTDLKGSQRVPNGSQRIPTGPEHATRNMQRTGRSTRTGNPNTQHEATQHGPADPTCNTQHATRTCNPNTQQQLNTDRLTQHATRNNTDRNNTDLNILGFLGFCTGQKAVTKIP
jgi:hypothetical protein